MFQVTSVLTFSSKNAFVTAYLLESSLARLKNFVCCFQTISCLLSFKAGNVWISSAASLFILTIFSPMEENKKFSHKCIHSKHFRVNDIKISNVTKATSQILLQTPWYLPKPQIILVSLCGNSFTDVGYNICQVETLLGYINRYHCVFWTGLLLTPTMLT